MERAIEEIKNKYELGSDETHEINKTFIESTDLYIKKLNGNITFEERNNIIVNIIYNSASLSLNSVLSKADNVYKMLKNSEYHYNNALVIFNEEYGKFKALFNKYEWS